MPLLNQPLILGQQFIAGQWLMGEAGVFQSYNPITGQCFEPNMSYATPRQIEQALLKAKSAFVAYSNTSLLKRAEFLLVCADEVSKLDNRLVERAIQETGYSEDRILTEKKRIVYQLHLFADLVKSGDFLDIRINTALPNRTPTPRPDLRYVNKALGPVVVFGASNFPLAYSVLGGDTVSALAAGCPVIVKGHNSHAGTCEIIAQAIERAIQRCDMPNGTFSLLFGEGNDIGQQLVKSPHIKAVGFTGSTQGGKALMKTAEHRDEPIPVFAEMGSINPVVLLPDTLEKNAADIAKQFVESFTAGAGQFCVSPGLLIAIDTPALQVFIDNVSTALANKPANVMLNEGIHQSFQTSLNAMKAHDDVNVIALGQKVVQTEGCFTQATLLQTQANSFLMSESLKEEAFGHAAILVVCKNMSDVLKVIESLPGQLSGTIQGDETELVKHQELITQLSEKVGRLVVNNFPTGVEVCEAMVHGGPFPASSDTRFTSVGTASIQRFIRPICLQNTPEMLLPDSLKNANPLKLNRLVDGVYTRKSIDF